MDLIEIGKMKVPLYMLDVNRFIADRIIEVEATGEENIDYVVSFGTYKNINWGKINMMSGVANLGFCWTACQFSQERYNESPVFIITEHADHNEILYKYPENLTVYAYGDHFDQEHLGPIINQGEY